MKKTFDDYEPGDPNKGVPLRDLLAKNGGKFKAVVEKETWFDETAKPKKKEVPPSEFVPDPNIKDS